MSDARLRGIEREATATGSPELRARVLVERLRVAPPCEACGGTGRRTEVGTGWKYELGRYPNLDPSAAGVAEVVHCTACAGTGSPLRARIELAAYCGDEGARHALGLVLPWAFPDFHGWVQGLSRWADVGPVPGWFETLVVRAAATPAAHSLPACGLTEDLLNSCDAWLEEPTVSRASEWWRAAEAWSQRVFQPVPQSVALFCPFPGNSRPEGGSDRAMAERVMASAGLAGEPAAREAVSRALVAFAAGGEA